MPHPTEVQIRDHKRLFRMFFDACLSDTLRIGVLPTFESPGIPAHSLGPEVDRAIAEDFRTGRVFDFGPVSEEFTSDMSARAEIMPQLMPPFPDWFGTFFAYHWEVTMGEVFGSLYVLLGERGGRIRVAELIYMPDQAQAILSTVLSIPLPFGSLAGGIPLGYTGTVTENTINSLINPMLTFMTILNTKGVEIVPYRLPRPERRRLLRDGTDVPEPFAVNSGLYFTALATTTTSSKIKGSGRASPIPHLRRGHWRQEKWIQACIVNASSSDEPAFVDQIRRRKAYRL